MISMAAGAATKVSTRHIGICRSVSVSGFSISLRGFNGLYDIDTSELAGSDLVYHRRSGKPDTREHTNTHQNPRTPEHTHTNTHYTAMGVL